MNITKKLIICIGLTLLTQVGFAQDTKIGVINLEQALFNSDAARIVQEGLQQEFSADEERAQTLSEELIALQEKFQQDQAIMSEDEIRRMNSDAQDLQVQLQLIQERVQAALQERNQVFVEGMREELAAAVNDVVAEGGFDLVLNAQSVAYMAPVLDISARVTAKLNENSQADN
ncbi:MAG: OmpH family outer membrane protein [Gammaproteobacteria bacterium]|nr:OmpH family outer membrane protein [Gammaproteobacteria bacterium]